MASIPHSQCRQPARCSMNSDSESVLITRAIINTAGSDFDMSLCLCRKLFVDDFKTH